MNINDLHKEALSGDKIAEDRLFQKLSERFEQFAHHRIWEEEDARDVAQEAMAIIAREYKSVQFETSFIAWAYKVLDNRLLGYIKKKRQRGDKVVTVDDINLAGGAMIEINIDLKKRLLDCLKKVGSANRRHARIVSLHYQGYNPDEISDRLRISKNAFYITLSRARKLLEICLETGKVA